MSQARDIGRQEHPAIIARRAMLDLATIYPALIYSLPRATGGGAGRVTGTPETPLPYRESVSAMLAEVSHLAWYLAQRLAFETAGQNRVRPDDLPALPDERLAVIARDLIGHFTPEDDADSQAFARDIQSLAKRAEAAAYPEGSRWCPVPNRADEHVSRRDLMPCAEPGCDGFYHMRIAADARWGITVADPATWPPLTCASTKGGNVRPNRNHIVTGTELARAVAYARSNGTTHLDELRRGRAA